MQIPEIKDYDEWLKTLNIGDKVGIEMFSEKQNTDYDIRKIIKIEDNIIEVHGMQKFENGIINRFVGNLTRLCPITQEVADIADRKRLLKALYGPNVKMLSTEKLRKIYDVINES
jgi:F0F1-type ATP synthase alpha subunit